MLRNAIIEIYIHFHDFVDLKKKTADKCLVSKLKAFSSFICCQSQAQAFIKFQIKYCQFPGISQKFCHGHARRVLIEMTPKNSKFK